MNRLLHELGALGGFLVKLVADTAGGVVVPKWLAAVGLAVLEYFLPTKTQQTAALGCLHVVLLDMATGIVASRRSGIPITSAGLTRTLIKIFGYSSVISVIATASNHIPGAAAAHGPIVTLVLGLVISTEGLSVLENVRRMGVTLPGKLEEWLSGRLRQLAGEIERDPGRDQAP